MYKGGHCMGVIRVVEVLPHCTSIAVDPLPYNGGWITFSGSSEQGTSEERPQYKWALYKGRYLRPQMLGAIYFWLPSRGQHGALNKGPRACPPQGDWFHCNFSSHPVHLDFAVCGKISAILLQCWQKEAWNSQLRLLGSWTTEEVKPYANLWLGDDAVLN